jgi:hypothetical protein
MSLNNCIASDFAAAAPTFRSRPRNRRVKRGVAVGAKLVKPFLLRDGLFCQSGRGNDVSVRSPAPIEAGSPGRPKSAPSPSPAQTAARVVGRTVFTPRARKAPIAPRLSLWRMRNGVAPIERVKTSSVKAIALHSPVVREECRFLPARKLWNANPDFWG